MDCQKEMYSCHRKIEKRLLGIVKPVTIEGNDDLQSLSLGPADTKTLCKWIITRNERSLATSLQTIKFLQAQKAPERRLRETENIKAVQNWLGYCTTISEFGISTEKI